MRDSIDQNEGGLAKFSQGYKYYGLNRGQKDGAEGIWYREWAPGARVRTLMLSSTYHPADKIHMPAQDASYPTLECALHRRPSCQMRWSQGQGRSVVLDV